MSLFSTIAHDGASPARGLSPRTIGIVVAGLALGVALGFIVVNNRTVTESSANSVAPAVGLTSDGFIRLNTTSYDGLAPAVPATASAVTQSQARVDPFILMNTTDLEGLALATSVVGVGSDFQYWNIASLEYLAARYTEQTGGPR